jgi:hypothetical protein
MSFFCHSTMLLSYLTKCLTIVWVDVDVSAVVIAYSVNTIYNYYYCHFDPSRALTNNDACRVCSFYNTSRIERKTKNFKLKLLNLEICLRGLLCREFCIFTKKFDAIFIYMASFTPGFKYLCAKIYNTSLLVVLTNKAS